MSDSAGCNEACEVRRRPLHIDLVATNIVILVSEKISWVAYLSNRLVRSYQGTTRAKRSSATPCPGEPFADAVRAEAHPVVRPLARPSATGLPGRKGV